MAKPEKHFLVDTSPTKEVVVDSITRDATDEECVFDLIDNSIDAARNIIFSHIAPKLRTELPDSYSGYEIRLSFSGAEFKIVDNCGGISIENLKDTAFRFGERSEQRMGIGAFGVGMNRAIFRLGDKSTLTTDTSTERAEVSLDKESYLKSGSWKLSADRLSSVGKAGTVILIHNLQTETSKNFGDPRWVAALKHQIARRYGRFIQKKLVIFVDRDRLQDEEIQIRENGPYQIREKLYRTEEGVVIEIKYGEHKLHRFPGERSQTDEQNRRLTPQYGWTILCNDRAVVMSDRSHKTGWDVQKFHSDFYGFVGYVNFVCQDPLKLPWKTTKTDVDLNNPAYQMALTDMRHFAAEWRSEASKRKKAKEPPTSPPPKESKKAGKETSGQTKKGPTPAKPITKPDHNKFRTVLPDDINEALCFDKHLALVRQAKDLDIVTFSYPGLALLRMLFEASTVKYMERKTKLGDLRTFAIDRRKKLDNWKPTPEQERNATITMDEMLAFYQHDSSIWGTASASYMRHIVAKMAKHQKTLNSAIHHPYQIINYTQALQIRDEALPLLRHLIEK
jgi:Histidine kinase-, DNA gyrase B-, and HSP90-like ATPase